MIWVDLFMDCDLLVGCVYGFWCLECCLVRLVVVWVVVGDAVWLSCAGCCVGYLCVG